MDNMDCNCGGLKLVYNIFVCVVIFVSFVNDIPQNQQVHHYSWTLFEENESAIATYWINPCGNIGTKIESGIRRRDPNLPKLRDSLPNFINRLQDDQMHAIDTSDIGDWFKHNATYTFLHQLDPTTNRVDLQKRHEEVQIYVGAFQHLVFTQKKYDILHNEGNEVTIEIQLLFILAKNLLCEIETTIERTGHSIKTVFTREGMDKLLTFRNNNSINKFSGEVDELDNKFAKVRFHEYVRNLQQLLNRAGKRNFRI
ncbi:uncharacterized protein LOC119080362 [Bradysia coprophila]|uniref:uncharacterized protein LOC119080362 n=1 Tax=Bradysia coprophila TaxID=38358 RepID=UPI00187DD2A6|nr:uncharacterized protein LOC119080362 [Bradysia coprophila]